MNRLDADDGDGQASRRAFLGLGAAAVAAGISATVAACSGDHPAPAAAAASAGRPRGAPRRVPAENSRPGDPHWEIRHLGAPDAIEGYAGASSVLTGESFPLFVSTTAAGFRVTAFRLGWYAGDGARQVWRSAPLRGHRQNGASVVGSTNTVRADWDPSAEVPTDDWPPGAYLLRLDADSGAQRVRAGDAGVNLASSAPTRCSGGPGWTPPRSARTGSSSATRPATRAIRCSASRTRSSPATA